MLVRGRESGTIKERVQNYAAAVLVIIAITAFLSLMRDYLTHENISLIYLLGVLVVAIWRGTGPSLLAAILSFLSYNFFVIRPLYTFLVADPRDVFDLVIFFIIAVIAGQLAAYARQQRDTARQRAAEQEMLYKLTSTFNQLTTREAIHDTVRDELKRNLPIREASILPESSHKPAPDDTTLYVLLQAGGTTYGTLCVTFDKAPGGPFVRLVNACAAQTALALQRVDLVQRAQRSKSFQEADRLKTALLHAVSHDLRTPITIIKSSASNLRTLYETLPKEERLELVKTINDEADELNDLVGNLLDMSRLVAGAFQLNVDWNSLEEVAGDIAARAWQRTHQRRIKINFPAEMPLARFDYGLILQALGNLVDNSLRYEPDESLVEIYGETKADEVRVAVINHGPNIPPEERAAVMEPFYHGKDGHIGLGLAIAKGIIEAHAGKIWLEDTPGRGVTFVFTLPFHPEEEVEDGQSLSR
jgi:two-component system, OmpR family, sensor histidine kinase KdpD